MAFSVADVDDLLRVLRENPEMRAAARREILGEELLTLPELVRQNSLDIQELQRVVAQNSADIRQNSADIGQNSADIRQNSTDIRQNSADIQTLQQVVAQLIREVDRLTVAVGTLEATTKRMEGRLGSVEGELSEMSWRARYAGRFGELIYDARLVDPRELTLFSQAFRSGAITDQAALAVRKLDLIIEGTRGRGADAREVVLAVEVSITIDDSDVERALSRSEILRGLGYDAVPVVAGSAISPRLRESAEASGVEVVIRARKLVADAI